ncbi:ABC transporter substrate-binding protein [Paraflavitalea sp. CAU 1676]|uniref:heme/hemin ABC transporter substrate-binding protein n=1 Tax=Paraflavitalea sp. CAU 1676 TaxID=3032598 RepID=UPI0023DA6BF6|nr:ABC transporter substrate-binding protein [Paraflavitalea sp. CAU 1676]MDF2187150.1 ABC transporter substrate-binding protein [Paraflavitalea sp. CAU 1676]
MLNKIILIISFLLAMCSTQAQQRIVSLSGAISEMLCALSLDAQIVGVDVTSNYPAVLQQKAKVGHNRTISAEGILALRPTLVLGVQGEMKQEVLEQMTAAKIKVQLLEPAYSADGTRRLLEEVANATGAQAKAKELRATFDKQLAALKIAPLKKKVLFIYARGTGSMTVSGTGTALDHMITLAGAQNAMTAFTQFKPLSAEALVAANPDVILMFDSGLQSIGGPDGLLAVQGVNSTNAGRTKKIVSMDGQFLSGFGLRLPAAIAELHKKLQ